MYVRRPERMSVHQLQQLASWPVKWDGIGRRADAVERIFTLGVCVEFAAEVVVDLRVVLLFVETFVELSARISRRVETVV